MSDHKNSEALAVVGMSARVPGARNVEELWTNLRSGTESISVFSDEELEEAGVDRKEFSDPRYVKAFGLLEGIEEFDARYFGYTPREARMMDPQHRLFLQGAVEVLEHAAIDPEQFEGRIGVYAGAGLSSYLIKNLPLDLRGSEEMQLLINNDKDYIPTRVAYKLNLRGPAVSVSTACSSSLAAVHMGAQALLDHQCEVAICGGVDVTVPQLRGYLCEEGSISSSDGHCRAFDSSADGTVFGNGVGMVALRRLEDAIACGDTIFAVVLGSAINNDGAQKVSFTAPSVSGQAEVVSEALSVAGVRPESISYVEAHGTGTRMGDPIEIAALTQAFGEDLPEHSCAIGSVKTNVGHLKAAAGAVGLIKTVLALHHRELPPSLHYESPNPAIDFKSGPFYVVDELCDWKRNGAPRRAGVTSAGFGGTNVHVVLEEAPTAGALQSLRDRQLLTLSANSQSALETMTDDLAAHLRNDPTAELENIAYSLHVGRRSLPYRRMLVARTVDQAASSLASRDPERVFTAATNGGRRSVAFLVPGQGSQYAGMAADLYRNEPVFKAHVDLCCETLEPRLGLDLRTLLFEQQASGESPLTQTALAQPALFVIAASMAKLWQSWGVEPDSLIGHSIGELVAGQLAGVFELSDALMLVAERGLIMQSMPTGAMLAVALSEEALVAHLPDDVCLAAVNGQTACVVSGPAPAIEAFAAEQTEKGVACTPLHTSHAFHSPSMDEASEAFAEVVARVSLSAPRLPFLSNVTGDWIRDEEATDPAYWGRQLRSPVRFGDGLGQILSDPDRLLVEVGPGHSLTTLARRHPGRAPSHALCSSIRHPQMEVSDVEFALEALGRVWASGLDAQWHTLHDGEELHRVPLPTYPFEPERHWVDPQPNRSQQPMDGSLRKIKDISDWFHYPSWRRSFAKTRRPVGEAETRSWLIFVDPCGYGEEISETLRSEGHSVVEVRPGDSFERSSSDRYVVDLSDDDAYDPLVSALISDDRVPAEVLHCWSVTAENHTREPRESFENRIASWEATQNLGFYSLLFLSRAFFKLGVTTLTRVSVVTSDMQRVEDREPACPDKATVLGAVRVLPQELPNIRCRSIDFQMPQDDAADRLIRDQLLSEVCTDTEDIVVALRGEHRWVQYFEALHLENRHSDGVKRLRNRAVVLITGGLGGIGFVEADYLASKVQARLILTGVNEMPERADWDHWLETHDPDDDVSDKILRVRNLEAMGSEVMVATCDAGNIEQSRRLFEQIDERFGRLDGVIHCAGVFETKKAFRGIEETAREDCERRFKPKVYGTLVLDELLKDRKLDFCLMQSSLSSQLGGLGFVSYSAGNIFMDAFADLHHRGGDIPWMSLNWDGWVFVEDDELSEEHVPVLVGQRQQSVIAASFASPSFGVVAEIAIRPSEGAEVLERVLQWGEVNQLLVSTADLDRRLDQWIQLDHRQASHATDRGVERQARADLANPYVAPLSEVEKVVAEIFGELLGIDQVGVQDNYFEMGGDSLLGIQVVSRISEALAVVPSVITMFENPTVAGLAIHIENLRWAAQSMSSAREEAGEGFQVGQI